MAGTPTTREPHLLDRAVRHMTTVPDATFMAWYDAFQQFRADERGDEPQPDMVQAPYYGAESCVLFAGKK